MAVMTITAHDWAHVHGVGLPELCDPSPGIAWSRPSSWVVPWGAHHRIRWQTVENDRELPVTTKPDGGELSPEAELRSFIDKFEPKEQKVFRSLRAALRKRFPTLNELAYEYPDSIVLGYSPTNRGIEAVVAIAVRADGVFLHLSHGPQLPDPKKLLQGSGKQTRFIRIDAAGQLGDPDVEALIVAAIGHATVPVPSGGTGKLVIQSSASRRQSRRKSTK